MNATDWKALYRIGGTCALSVVAIIAIQMIVFFTWPPPMDASVQEWFAVFQQSGFRGLLDMDLLLIVDYALLVPLYLALFVALKSFSRAWMAVATTLLILGAAAFFASNPCFEMLSLSAKHAGATSELEETIYLAAGQGMLESWEGTAFNVSYILGALGTTIVSFVMLRSKVFSRRTAHFGIAMGAMMIVPPTVGGFAIVLSLLSLIPTVSWLILVSRRLMQLGRDLDRHPLVSPVSLG